MKTFQCYCGAPLYFENTYCSACGSQVGFNPDSMSMTTLANAATLGLRACDNYVKENVCNWFFPETHYNFCRACRLNQVIPNLSTYCAHRVYWSRLETAKRRAVYSLLLLELPVIGKGEDAQNGLAFSFMADSDPASEFTAKLPDVEKIVTGHDSGHITINLAEADDVARARARVRLGERYRTILGHFRHELGHYYWDRLVAHSNNMLRYRSLFGDETIDYAQAIDQYYKNGPPDDWTQHYVSAYAAMHPFEDWAETWSHYMHIVDTLDTAYHFKVGIDHHRIAPHGTSFEQLFNDWITLVIPLNELNLSLGYDDSYPFVLTDTIRQKLQFVHEVIANRVK